MSKVFVIGGGAAGMMAAIAAAENYNEVHLYEKNEKLGKKLFITGKGRCNVTNASDLSSHFNNIVDNQKFLYSAYSSFSAQDVMEMIEEAGTPLKVERGNRVFPKSDRSSDVIKALTKLLREGNVDVNLNSEVESIEYSDDYEQGQVMIKLNNKKLYCDACIIATGGYSYRTTGSSGDGYRFARELGHNVTKLYPGLVPFNVDGEICNRMQGLALKNVKFTLMQNEDELYSDMGEMMFTHFGITGPLILTASSIVSARMNKGHVKGVIDLKPALSYEALDKRILKDFDENINRIFRNSLDQLLPKKIIPIIIELSKINPEKKVNEITKEERKNLVNLIKNMELSLTSTRGFNEAIITKGGVELKDINPKNMESKIIPGVYFVGEVLDLDAFTGGYNLQIAWSTGYLAGHSIY